MARNGKDEINIGNLNTNVSQESPLYEVKMDDIHINSSINVPRVYGMRRLEGKIVDLVETDM